MRRVGMRLGLRRTEVAIAKWPELVDGWLRTIDITEQ